MRKLIQLQAVASSSFGAHRALSPSCAGNRGMVRG